MYRYFNGASRQSDSNAFSPLVTKLNMYSSIRYKAKQRYNVC